MSTPTRYLDDMPELWQGFEGWLADHWAEGLDMLQPPAADDDIRALEEALGVKLPQDFIACLKIHNGQGGMGPLLDGMEFLSVQEIREQWQVWAELVDAGEFDDCASEPQAGIKRDWFNRRWIPITHDGGGNHLCLDLDPAPGGVRGQVITMWHDSAERERIADSFHAFFAAYVQGLFSGRYVYDEEYGGIVEGD